jgi:hypothetical protein
MLADGPLSLASLAARGVLYDPEKAPPWAPAAERHTITQHLRELVNQGRVVAAQDGLFGLA